MPKIKTLLMLSMVMGLSLSLLGCGLLTSSNADPEITAGQEGALPEWLLADHRSLSVDIPDEQNDDEAVVPASTEPVPVQSTPAASQPAESVSSNTVPKWQKPGTMEYIAKMMLDEKVSRYKRLIARANTASEDENNDPAEIAVLKVDIPRIAEELGIDLKSVYGITISTASTTGTGDWFYNMDSPSGFGN